MYTYGHLKLPQSCITIVFFTFLVGADIQCCYVISRCCDMETVYSFSYW